MNPRPIIRSAGLLVALGAGSAFATAAAPAAHAEPNASTVMFVVDTSGSMEGQPLEQAKQALRDGAAALNPGQASGLRAYGGDCGDGGDLVVPIEVDNAAQIDTAADALVAGGRTPTPEALTAAAADLPASGDRTIILISDGESTCGDPCPVAAQLAEDLGIGFTVHTVGFNAPEAAADELSCVAEATGGTYFQATDGASLGAAITTATKETTDVDTGVAPVGGVDTGERPSDRVGTDETLTGGIATAQPVEAAGKGHAPAPVLIAVLAAVGLGALTVVSRLVAAR